MQPSKYLSLSDDVVSALLTRKVNREQPYNSYPTCIDNQIFSRQEIMNICDCLLNELRSGKGYSIVRISEEVLKDIHDIKVTFWNLFTCFAKPLAQFSNGNVLHEVQKADAPPPPRCSYSMSDKVTDIHTDGSYLYELPPHFIGLICLRQAEIGGESILVDGRKILHQLKTEYPENMKYLMQDYQFNTDNQLEDSKTLTKPIIVENDSTIIFNYNRIHIESGQRAIKSPLTGESKDSMNKLDLLLHRQENQDIFSLRSGEMLVINNHYILHGRNSFNDNKNSKRLLIRLWGKEWQIFKSD